MLTKLSSLLATFERCAAIFCTAAITLLIIMNVVTRALNHALYWVDEAAIYAMVWMLFFSIALLLKRREAVSVTIVYDLVPLHFKKIIGRIVDWSVLVFSVFLIAFSWLWYQPLELIKAGFDFSVFSAETMNFIYQDKANTLAIKKFWVWLIIPYFAFSVFIHALSNVLTPYPSIAENTQPVES